MGYDPQKSMLMGYQGFMGYALQTKLGDVKLYGISGVMGSKRYGLRGV